MEDPGYYRLLRVWRGIGLRWWTLLGSMNAVAMIRISESAHATAPFLFWILTVCVISIHGAFGVLHATMVFVWQNKRLDYMPAMWVHNVGADSSAGPTTGR